MKTLRLSLFTLSLFTFASLPLWSQESVEELEEAIEAAAEEAEEASEEEEKAEEKPKYWKQGLSTNIVFNQVSLNNWAGGGDNSMAVTGLVKGFMNYEKGRTLWETQLDLAYGRSSLGDGPFRKSDDRIELNSKFGHKITKDNDKWFFSGLYNLRTQFDEGFRGPESTERISKFAAPAFMLFSLGVDFRPVSWFAILTSPVTSKVTVVADEELSNAGAFGIDPGDRVRYEIGSFVKMRFSKEIFPNVKVDSKLDFFSNYLEKPQNLDVNWENNIVLKINKWLSTTLITHLIYDDDIEVPIFDDQGVQVGQGPKIQWRQVLGVGLSFNI